LAAVVWGNEADLGWGHHIPRAGGRKANRRARFRTGKPAGAPIFAPARTEPRPPGANGHARFQSGEPNFVAARTEHCPPGIAKSCLPAPVLETIVRRDCAAPHRAGLSGGDSAGDVTAPTIGGPGSPVVWAASSPTDPLTFPQFPFALVGGLCSGLLLLFCLCFGLAMACGQCGERRGEPAWQIGMRGEPTAVGLGGRNDGQLQGRATEACTDFTFTEKGLRRTKPSEYVRVARAPPIA
jgi:hypothetical protein